MELLDVYDDNGKITGRVVERGNKDIEFNSGEHIAVSIIFIENSKGEYLIQKTSKQKGGLYTSTGGHVNHGERPIETIRREISEELGIDVSEDKIIDLGFVIFDFPIRFLFYLKKDIKLSDIVLQDEEVESVSFMSLDEIENIINNKLMLESHALVFDKILEYKKDCIDNE